MPKDIAGDRTGQDGRQRPQHGGQQGPTFDMEELNRLIGRGIPPQTALRVLEGKLDEGTAVANIAEARAVDEWLRGRTGLPEYVEPRWDLAPKRFYLSLDGASPDDQRFVGVMPIEADLAETVAKLTFASTRTADPWDEKYREKTAKTAYRWSEGMRVTPPLVYDHGGKIQIEGGLHRFHLALHYRATRIPLLVDGAMLSSVLKLLPSARPIPPEDASREDEPKDTSP